MSCARQGSENLYISSLLTKKDPAVKEKSAETKDVVAWAYTKGLTVVADDRLRLAPITLRPHPYPRAAFEQAWALAEPFGKLIDGMKRDWLLKSLEAVAKTDGFVGKLSSISKRVYESGYSRGLRMHILRSDFLLHKEEDGKITPKLVEVNTIAASFGGLIEGLNYVHQFWQTQYAHSDERVILPNAPITGIARSLLQADKAYQKKYGVTDTVVIMVVHSTTEHERNEIDQRKLQAAFFEMGGRIERWGLDDLRTRFSADLAGERERLMFPIVGSTSRRREVSCVYWRTGYSPGSYTDVDWEMREKIERSCTIQIPSCLSQLAGAKKIQQLFSSDSDIVASDNGDSQGGKKVKGGLLKRFGLNNDEITKLQKCFVQNVDPSATDPESRSHVMDAKANPLNWVLKPNREGGGNNLYDDDIVKKLNGGNDLHEYVLMKKICPPSQAVTILDGSVFPPQPKVFEGVSELGIYHTFLADEDQVLSNEALGYLVRTKNVNQNEGGVNAGFSFLDTPWFEK
jgi:glutathione synthetase